MNYKTCGEISCEECNDRYEQALARIAELERATPFLGGWNGYEKIRDDIEAFLARYHAGEKPQNNSEQNK